MKSSQLSDIQPNSACEFHLSFEGHKVNYFFSGNEHCVVLLHGYLEDHSVWHAIRLQLKDYKLLVPDLPGHGKSELPVGADWMEYTLSVLTHLLDEHRIKKCTLIGHSMGGYVAMEYARRFSNRLSGLGLISTHPFQDSEQKKRRRKKEIQLLNNGKHELLLSAFKNQIDDAVVRAYFDDALQCIEAATMVAVQKALLKRRDNTQLFNSPVWPVSVLFGAQDGGLPIQELKGLLNVSEQVMSQCLPGGNHYLILKHPDVVVDCICGMNDV